MTDRVRCKTPGCEAQILLSTAASTGGFCMPCTNRSKADERARRIIAERVDVDRFAGIEDPVEILLRIHRPPPRDERVNYVPYARPVADVYRSLSQGDVDRLVAAAAAARDRLRSVATRLACSSPRDLTTCQSRLLDSGDPYPVHAFRAASELVVHRLLVMIDDGARGSTVVLSHALSALAWSGSPRADLALRRWRDEPPSWRQLLHWPPERYALVAGYELGDDGKRRELVLPATHKLSKDDSAAGLGDAAVFERDPSGTLCPQCGRPATLLLRIDAAHLPGVRFCEGRTFRAPTCVDCAMYEQVFVRFSDDLASWEWLLPLKASSAGHEHPLQLTPTSVTLTPREPWAAADWCIADGISQIGGYPSWINDPTYPNCPVCTRTMMTIAQVAPEDFVGPAEGVFYVHVCDRCPVVGASYDQT